MRNTLSQAIRIVFNPETILPFLVGSVFLAVFGNAVYDIFKNVVGSSTSDLVKIAVMSLLLLAIAVGVVSWVISRRLSRISAIAVPFEVQQKQLERQYRGLVVLVSRQETCETAIRFHLPVLERCWLICSRERLAMAQELCRMFPQVCLDAPLVVNDIYNPLEFRDRVAEIYQSRLPKGWQQSEVIADYTGMTAHASVGTVLACVGTVRSMQYTPARVDEQGKVVGSLPPIRIKMKMDQPKL